MPRRIETARTEDGLRIQQPDKQENGRAAAAAVQPDLRVKACVRPEAARTAIKQRGRLVSNTCINRLFNSILTRHSRLTSMAQTIPGAQRYCTMPGAKRGRLQVEGYARSVVDRRRFHRCQIANPRCDQIGRLTIDHG